MHRTTLTSGMTFWPKMSIVPRLAPAPRQGLATFSVKNQSKYFMLFMTHMVSYFLLPTPFQNIKKFLASELYKNKQQDGFGLNLLTPALEFTIDINYLQIFYHLICKVHFPFYPLYYCCQTCYSNICYKPLNILRHFCLKLLAFRKILKCIFYVY